MIRLPPRLNKPKLTPYDCYCAYLGLKQHFTRPSYDFFKYNGKVSASESTFQVRNDYFKFVKLSKHQDPVGLILSNLVVNQNAWIGDILSPEGDEVYAGWSKRQGALLYSLRETLGQWEEVHPQLVVPPNGLPALLSKMHSHEVALDDVCLLQAALNFIPYWDENITTKILWDDKKALIENYLPFLDYDLEKVKQVVNAFL